MPWQLCGGLVALCSSSPPQRSGRNVMGQVVSTPAGEMAGDGLNVENDMGDVASVGDGGGTGRRTRHGVVMHGGGPAEQLHRCHVDAGWGGGGGGRSVSDHTE